MSRSHPSRAASSDAATAATILPVIERLRAAVEAENREIANRCAVDYRAHTQRKNQGLFELLRLKALVAEARSHPAVKLAFAGLEAKLETNRRLLGAQLKAAKTVSGIVAKAIRDGQSDGTYSAHPWRDEPR
jgi:hypothetical protein